MKGSDFQGRGTNRCDHIAKYSGKYTGLNAAIERM